AQTLVQNPPRELRARLRVAHDHVGPDLAEEGEGRPPRGDVLLHRVDERLATQRTVGPNLQARSRGRHGRPVIKRLQTRAIPCPPVPTNLCRLSPAFARHRVLELEGRAGGAARSFLEVLSPVGRIDELGVPLANDGTGQQRKRLEIAGRRHAAWVEALLAKELPVVRDVLARMGEELAEVGDLTLRALFSGRPLTRLEVPQVLQRVAPPYDSLPRGHEDRTE